jgi:nucleotide-binding universal stress UspA family protein
MTSPTQILVPVDFSTSSRAALDYASELSKKLGATLDVLHVWQAPAFVPLGSGVVSPGVGEASLIEMVRKNAEEGLDAFVEEAQKRGVAVRSSRTIGGPAAFAIVDAAKEGNYDLIVIGTHGRTGLPRVLLGSVAETVVRHAHCPVLTVRSPR